MCFQNRRNRSSKSMHSDAQSQYVSSLDSNKYSCSCENQHSPNKPNHGQVRSMAGQRDKQQHRVQSRSRLPRTSRKLLVSRAVQYTSVVLNNTFRAGSIPLAMTSYAPLRTLRKTAISRTSRRAILVAGRLELILMRTSSLTLRELRNSAYQISCLSRGRILLVLPTL